MIKQQARGSARPFVCIRCTYRSIFTKRHPFSGPSVLPSHFNSETQGIEPPPADPPSTPERTYGLVGESEVEGNKSAAQGSWTYAGFRPVVRDKGGPSLTALEAAISGRQLSTALELYASLRSRRLLRCMTSEQAENLLLLFDEDGRRDILPKVRDIFHQLRLGKSKPSALAYMRCIQAHLKRRSDVNWVSRLLAEMDATARYPRTEHLTLMLSRATEVGDVDKARMVYDRLRRLGMGKMTGLMHAEMMALLTRSGRLDEAIALQGTLLKDPTRKRGFAPSLFIYIIGALMQKCDYEAASKQVDLMLSAKSGFRTCRQKAAAENACNIALDLYIRMNDQKRALWILELMQTRSLTPRAELLHKFADSMAKTDNGNFAAVENVSTISGLARSQLNRRFNLMSQINNGNLTAAERDLGEMIRQGWNPDAPILKAMLEAYAKKGDVVGSQRAFERLEELGTPNVFAYTMLIQAHLNVGDLAQARWRFDNMKVAGLQPDTVLYTLMMKAYVELQSTGGIKEAEALLREMRAVGVPRNQRTYFTLIAASRDSPERAGAYISEMRREGIDPDAGCFGAMIDVCVRAGNMRKAYGYFQSMAGLNIRPNAVIFNILLAEHHKNGEFDAIRRLYKEMVMGRIAPDANTIHKIVDAYCKFGKDMDIVEEVIEKLLAATSPSFRPRQQIFHSVMNGYAHAGMPASCERWRDRMLASGFEATFITSNILLNAYCRAEDHFKVMALFKQMLKNGQVTPATMAQVLDSCGLNGAPEDATWVVERARAAGTSLDENGYNSYLEALGRHRRIGEIRPALYSMLADGVEPTSKTFLTAVNAVERQGKLREAKEVRSFFETHFPSLVK